MEISMMWKSIWIHLTHGGRKREKRESLKHTRNTEARERKKRVFIQHTFSTRGRKEKRKRKRERRG